MVFLFTFTFLGFFFGWSKTLISNRRRLKRGKYDAALIAAAGPLANLLIAVAVYALVRHVTGFPSHQYLDDVVNTAIGLNLSLTVLNLIPLPPLDGSRIIGAIMPEQMLQDWERLDEFGPILLIAMIVLFQQQFGAAMKAVLIRIFDLVGVVVLIFIGWAMVRQGLQAYDYGDRKLELAEVPQ